MSGLVMAFWHHRHRVDLQVGMLGDRLAFLVEWLDPASGITWKYQLLQYPENREIEMVGAVFEPWTRHLCDSLAATPCGVT